MGWSIIVKFERIFLKRDLMRIFQVTVFFFLFIFCSGLVDAQQLKENELVVIHGEKFVLHQVRTGETLFSISKKYNIDSNEVVENNPDIKKDGLKIGAILKIPYNENANLSQAPVYKKGDPSRFEHHTITSRNETPYFIAKEYNISVEEIYAYNPEVKRFKKGTELRIPIWDAQPQPISEKTTETSISSTRQIENVQNQGTSDNLQVHIVKSGETLYSISQQYQVSMNEIIKYNPDQHSLKAGAKIYIPKQNLSVKTPAKHQETMLHERYFEHVIESGETMWGITQKYDVTETELKTLNPVLETGFPAGVVIKIPLRDVTTVEAKPVNSDAFEKYQVQKGETLHGLAEQFHMTIPEIKQYNPALAERNLLINGEVILIPRKPELMEEQPLAIGNSEETRAVPEYGQAEEESVSDEFYKVEIPVEIPESCKPDNMGMFTNDTYTISLFLPLFLEANDTLNKETIVFTENMDSLLVSETTDDKVDTLVEEGTQEDKFIKFYGTSRNFLQFYEGVLLAIDSMQNRGMNIKLNVFDTQQKPDSIRRFIYSSDFLKSNLIIGPVYPNVQSEVASIAAKNRIPMISPLAAQSDHLKSNPYYYQVNPDRDYLALKTAELVADEYFNSNFVVVKTNNYANTPEGKIVNMIQEKLYNTGLLNQPNGVSFSIYDFEHEGAFGLRRILSKEKENVIYIPSANEGEISVAISNISNLADDYSITLLGSNRYQQYQSIEIEKFHALKLKYIGPYWVDYKKPSTIDFLEKFKSNFYTEPDNFGMQGYDITFYFLNALKVYGNDFYNCLPYLQVDLTQGNYQFEKVSQFGGYMNQGVSVISYKPNYDIVRERVEGQLHLATN